MASSVHAAFLPHTQEGLLEFSLSSLLGQQALLDCRAGEGSEALPPLHSSVGVSLGPARLHPQDSGEGVQQNLED